MPQPLCPSLCPLPLNLIRLSRTLRLLPPNCIRFPCSFVLCPELYSFSLLLRPLPRIKFGCSRTLRPLPRIKFGCSRTLRLLPRIKFGCSRTLRLLPRIKFGPTPSIPQLRLDALRANVRHTPVPLLRCHRVGQLCQRSLNDASHHSPDCMSNSRFFLA